MLADHFTVNTRLIDLGDHKPQMRGIFSPIYDDALVNEFLNSQFLADANDYLNKYQSTEHWRCLLQHAMTLLPAPLGAAPRVLDIGSGSGNSVFPLLDLLPKATVVASDLSLPLLCSLKRHLDERYSACSCVVVQLNAEEIFFGDDQFDLVVGAAVLHHLFDPERAIREVARVLRPGGAALFFEPFELGNQILVLAMQHLLSRNSCLASQEEALQPEVVRFFLRLIQDFCLRNRPDKTLPVYANLDDKWTFTRSFFERAARHGGLTVDRIYNLYPSASLYSGHLNTYLLLGLGSTLSSLPAWARNEVVALDTLLSPDAQHEVFVEGGVVLSKPA